MSEQDNMDSNLREEPNRKEPKQISFRVSELEYEKLKQSAETLNMSVPNFVKKKAYGSKLVAPKFDVESRQSIVRELSSVGNNINQISKHLNKLEKEDKPVNLERLNRNFDVVRKELNNIWQQLN